MAFASRLARISARQKSLILGFGCAAISGVSMVPQMFFKNQYKKLLAMYQDSELVPVSQHVQNLIHQTTYDMNLEPLVEVDIEFFTCYGQDPVHIGSTTLRTGAMVGLPGTFRYADISDIDTGKLMVSGRPPNWESRAGQQLLHSIILTDDAKKFAIAREIEYAGNYHIHVIATMRGFFACMAFATGNVLNTAFQLKSRLKTWARGITYIFVGAIWAGIYITVKDTYECHRDKRNDRWVASISDTYAKGGLEYYNKMLERNKAIRTLMKAEGEALYTAYGNKTAGWRQPHVQITKRRDYMAKMVEGYQKGEVTARSRENRMKFGVGRV